MNLTKPDKKLDLVNIPQSMAHTLLPVVNPV
jgi:hypothetical protein